VVSKSVEFSYGNLKGTITTGEIARQALGSVTVNMGETFVLATVCAKTPEVLPGFLPLQVEYREKDYAKSKIRSGYIKREARPSEREILIARLLDRTVRPMFPKDFQDEVQVVLTVHSVDPAIGTVIPSMVAMSAALQLTGLPCGDTVALSEVSYNGTEFSLKNYTEENHLLDLIVSGTRDAILMVESGSNELSEDVILKALEYGQEQYKPIIEAIESLKSLLAVEAWSYKKLVDAPDALKSEVEQSISEGIADAFGLADKKQRQSALADLAKSTLANYSDEQDIAWVKSIISNSEKSYVRKRILDGFNRIDGRDTETVRSLSSKVGFLARTHGSSLFTRGETQALVTCTLGSESEGQRQDDYMGNEEKQLFMLHYNFPPYSVGEVGMMGSTKRREIGHGNLARKALEAALPSFEDFPYAIRVVSEITESNGSSSMASVCGGSLAMMDAGVPLKSPVAGIAMGLVIENGRYKVLTDILGDEDHLGDMDFKVAGTGTGITALQMDIKVKGITLEIMQQALKQAKDARLHILQSMNTTLSKSRENLSKYAPQVVSININPDKIRDVIGKGGATIREIIDTHKVEIDISDDGLVKVVGQDQAGIDGALARIEELTKDVEIGQIYQTKVLKIMEFGAFVSLIPGKDGFLHISQISNERVENISDWLKEGQEIVVKVTEIDKQNRIRVSMKAMQSEIS
jgi:polyribonucleotide nucleotidyltransferase